jgi:AcrR family transcriptional regulator
MTTKTMRADAVRNREALLAAARQCFARDGDAAGMEEVAAAAGVGIGTLYRHFPTKSDLVHALFTERLAEFAELADPAHPGSPWDRLVTTIRAIVQTQSVNRALSDAPTCEIAATRPELRTVRDQLTLNIGSLMAGARASGELRPDVGVDDVLTFCFNANLTGNPAGWETYARVVIDGLRASASKGRA